MKIIKKGLKCRQRIRKSFNVNIACDSSHLVMLNLSVDHNGPQLLTIFFTFNILTAFQMEIPYGLEQYIGLNASFLDDQVLDRTLTQYHVVNITAFTHKSRQVSKFNMATLYQKARPFHTVKKKFHL